MAISLYTFRELLKLLGVEDYGIYNVVGGVVIMFSFLSTAMTQANQRYLSYNIGLGEKGNLQKTFSIIINVQAIISLVILFLCETIGLWFVNNKMNFDGEIMGVVNIVYQLSILTFIVQIFQIPYTSAIISHEKMAFFSYFSIGEALLKLMVVVSLNLFTTNRLIIYTLLLLISAILIFLVYWWYCRSAFTSCRYVRTWDRGMIKELTGFTGWNMLSGLGNVGANQGVNVILNIFCGVVVNAAMGISHQVSVAITSLIGNMQMAFNPQIIKAYASEDYDYFNALIFRSARLSFFLILIIGAPIFFCANTILNLWLTDVPIYAVQFTQCNVIYYMIDAIAGPLWIANQASGKVKQYMIVLTFLLLFNIPISYFLLKLGYSPVLVAIVRVLINAIILCFRMGYIYRTIRFPLRNFLKEVVIRVLGVSIVVFSCSYICYLYILQDEFYKSILLFVLILGASIIFGFYMLLSKLERNYIESKICSVIRKIR